MTSRRREQLFCQLENDKVRLEYEIEHLRQFERQYRVRLKKYFEDQTRFLQGRGTTPGSAIIPPDNPFATE